MLTLKGFISYLLQKQKNEIQTQFHIIWMNTILLHFLRQLRNSRKTSTMCSTQKKKEEENMSYEY